jgi:hypothetical protein
VAFCGLHQASLLCSRALEAGQTWADAQARADLMDEGALRACCLRMLRLSAGRQPCSSTLHCHNAGKKSVLAALTEHQMNMGLSKAAAETKARRVSSAAARRWCMQRALTPALRLPAQALCMPEYTDHVLRMTEARHKALSARIVYDALKKEVDLVRTFEASRRYDPRRSTALPARLSS